MRVRASGRFAELLGEKAAAAVQAAHHRAHRHAELVGGLAVLRTLQQPVLDLYAANDVATVDDNADARRRAGAQMPAGNFRQVAVAGARAGFVGVQEQLVATVRAWLAAHSAGR